MIPTTQLIAHLMNQFEQQQGSLAPPEQRGEESSYGLALRSEWLDEEATRAVVPLRSADLVLRNGDVLHWSTERTEWQPGGPVAYRLAALRAIGRPNPFQGVSLRGDLTLRVDRHIRQLLQLRWDLVSDAPSVSLDTARKAAEEFAGNLQALVDSRRLSEVRGG